MKIKRIAITLLIVLVLGIILSCTEAELTSSLYLTSDEEHIAMGIGTLFMTYLIEAAYRMDPDTPEMSGLAGTYNDSEGSFSFTYTNFNFDTEDEEDTIIEGSFLLNGTHSRTISGTTTTESLDITLDVSDGNTTERITVKIDLTFEGSNEEPTNLLFKVNGKSFTKAEVEALFDFDEDDE
ncbi:MAG: hypothetical protein WC182_07580 [Bacilli bacterium]|jgi:hypothetical protein